MRIKEYLTNTEVSPFNEWYRKLDNSLQARVDSRLQRIQILGNLGDYKPLGDGIYEMRFR